MEERSDGAMEYWSIEGLGDAGRGEVPPEPLQANERLFQSVPWDDSAIVTIRRAIACSWRAWPEGLAQLQSRSFEF